MIQVLTVKSSDELWKLSQRFAAKGCIYEIPDKFPAAAIILDYPHYVQIDTKTLIQSSLAVNL